MLAELLGLVAVFAQLLRELVKFGSQLGYLELLLFELLFEHFGAGRSVVIGDSITDLRMAEVADLVFARAPLSDWLDERGIAYHRWEDFGDVAAVLRREGLLGAVAA